MKITFDATVLLKCFFFVWVSLLCLAVEGFAAQDDLRLATNTKNFVENKTATFNCIYLGNEQNMTMRWFVQNPHTKEKVAAGVNRQMDKWVVADVLQLQLAVRRDYEGHDFVCQSGDKSEKRIRIKKVTHTLPIKHVTLLDLNFEKGECLKYCCGVQANKSQISHVVIHDDNKTYWRTQPQASCALNERDDVSYWLCYCWTSTCSNKYQAKASMNRNRWYCEAHTKTKSTNVFSEYKEIFVYFADISQTNMSHSNVTVATPVTASLLVLAHPPPQNNQFVIGQLAGQSLPATGVTIRTLDRFEYKITMNFSPMKTGTYYIDFTGLWANASSLPYTIGILDSPRHWIHNAIIVIVFALFVLCIIVLILRFYNSCTKAASKHVYRLLPQTDCPKELSEKLRTFRDFKSAMESNIQDVGDLFSIRDTRFLFNDLHVQLSMEKSFCDQSDGCVRENFWRLISVRPDLASQLASNLESSSYERTRAAELIRTACGGRLYEETYWDPNELDWTTVPHKKFARGLRLIDEALVGLASCVYCNPTLQSQLRIRENSARPKPFSPEIGRQLARELSGMRPDDFRQKFECNEFIMCLLSIACAPLEMETHV